VVEGERRAIDHRAQPKGEQSAYAHELARTARQDIAPAIDAPGNAIDERVDRSGRSRIEIIEHDFIGMHRQVVEKGSYIGARLRNPGTNVEKEAIGMTGILRERGRLAGADRRTHDAHSDVR
jgi:hypothetical protein